MLAADAADDIVGFLDGVHSQDHTPPTVVVAAVGRDDGFDDLIDEEIGPITIRDVPFRASDILFELEPEGYRIYLAEYRTQTGGDGQPDPRDPAP